MCDRQQAAASMPPQNGQSLALEPDMGHLVLQNATAKTPQWGGAGCVAQELVPAWFAGCQTVGLTAGTSTLDETIDEVHAALSRM